MNVVIGRENILVSDVTNQNLSRGTKRKMAGILAVLFFMAVLSLLKFKATEAQEDLEILFYPYKTA